MSLVSHSPLISNVILLVTIFDQFVLFDYIAESESDFDDMEAVPIDQGKYTAKLLLAHGKLTLHSYVFFSLCYVEIFTTQATQEVKNVEAKKDVKSDQPVDSSDESSGDSDESGNEESDDEQVFFSFETLFLLDIFL